MYKSMLFASFALTSSPLYALDTRHTPAEQLLELGSELAASAGSSQWQQLWHSVREAGYLHPHTSQVHFTLPASQLPGLARQTLAQADQVYPVQQTRALYRRNFSDRVVGKRGEHAFSALCLLVDWRALPQGMTTTPRAYLKSASLLSSYPCD
ncbi:TPA: hypothetical protein QEM96_002510 [Pseudomonas putida]|nr:hypothetical protein [Pseudomonas putida]